MGAELLFGAAYYTEYMPYDRVEKDLDMMKQAGMNVVRIAESTWSTLEPEDNVYDFTCIDRVLDEAEKKRMRVIIGTPTYAVPAWLVKKNADVLVTTLEGRADYGHRQLINLLNPAFRFHAERVIRKLLEHTAERPCVIGYQIDNETKHYGNAGKQAQELFRSYLKEKFQSTERLNRTFHLEFWSNALSDWEDFPDMKGCRNGGLASEFEKFQRRFAAEYLQWQSDIVEEYRRADQFITHNFDFEWKKFGADIAQDGYSYGVQPDINHCEASRAVTIAGTDIYHPTQDHLTGAEFAFGGDEIRSLKNDNYLVLECQAQAFKYWTPYPGQLRLHAYSHLASGAVGMMYWNWHSIHNGYETYWKGLLSHDLRPNPAYEEAALLGREWRGLGDRIAPLKKRNRTALVIDNHCLTGLKWFPIDRDLSYNDVVRWMYDSLYELNIECDITDINALDPERYDLIVTPALYSVTGENTQKLRRFVEKGGTLVSSFRSFVADEYLTVRHEPLPFGMTEVFGMSYQQFTEPERMTVKGAPVRYFAELLEPEAGESLADYEHRYWKRYAGITRCRYGEGHAYYVGGYIEKEILKEIYRKAAEDAGIVNEAMDYEWPVIFRSGMALRPLHYLLHYGEEARSIRCPYAHVTDLLTGEQYQKGDEIRLTDWDVKILEEY